VERGIRRPDRPHQPTRAGGGRVLRQHQGQGDGLCASRRRRHGRVDELEAVRLLPEPPAASARIGIGFGIRFRSFGDKDGAQAPLRSVWKIPEPGIHNPTNGNTYRQSVSEFTTTIGSAQWRGYGFDEPREVVPGTWTIEIWQGDRKLLEQSFTITAGQSGGGADPSPK
jgi:hypothetical protein